MCVCGVCVVIRFILHVRLVDVPAGATQEEGHTEFIHLPSAVLALLFIARRIQSNFVYPRINRSPLVRHDFLFFYFIFVRKNPSMLQ